MDFFEHQDQARRQTKLLIVYYILAVILIVFAVYAAVAILAAKTSDEPLPFFRPDLFLTVTIVTVMIIAAGSAYKTRTLSAGGEAVATMLGGRPVHPGTPDLDERRLINVVEEVAIASGTPVPRVFILEGEQGINAFAAGLTFDDAVVAVTRGCLTQLSRDELQGVIAHEFSHILNGDMRLNVRLMGVLHGILLLGILGYWIFRSSLHSSGRSRSNSKGNTMPIALFGFIVMAVGYIGVFFGRLIKAAVSKQREYLADAAAVQFTRNPAGIAGALKKIGGWLPGSRIENTHAEEASHFFFSNGLRPSFASLLATHPPLADRIRRLDPAFRGSFEKVSAQPSASGSAAAASGLAAAAAGTGRTSTKAVSATVGAPQKEHMEFAEHFHGKVPPALLAAAHEPFGARALVYTLLLDRDPRIHSIQMERLAAHADPAVFRETTRIEPLARELPETYRLPLVEIALTALNNISPEQYLVFRENLLHLTRADERIDLFEYGLQYILVRHLDRVLFHNKPPRVRHHHLRPLLPQTAVLLSSLAHRGTPDEAEAGAAFTAGTAQLGEEGRKLKILAPGQCALGALDPTLKDLAQAAPPVKKLLVSACTACVTADGNVTAVQADLLRIIPAALDCPLLPSLLGN